MTPYNFIEIDNEFIAVPNTAYWNLQKEKKFQILLKKSGIPKDYWSLDFKDYIGTLSVESKNKAIKYSCFFDKEDFKTVSLYLYGNHSCQKTAIACIIGKTLLKQSFDVKFVYASELIDLLLKDQGYNYDREIVTKIKKYQETDCLIIDDIFDVSKTTYFSKNPDLILAAWDSFLRKRLQENKRIILTSNFSITALQEKFGVSIFNLIQRNFYELSFFDEVKETITNKFDNLFS